MLPMVIAMNETEALTELLKVTAPGIARIASNVWRAGRSLAGTFDVKNASRKYLERLREDSSHLPILV